MKTFLAATFLVTALAAQVNAAERHCAPKHVVLEELARLSSVKGTK